MEEPPRLEEWEKIEKGDRHSTVAYHVVGWHRELNPEVNVWRGVEHDESVDFDVPNPEEYDQHDKFMVELVQMRDGELNRVERRYTVSKLEAVKKSMELIAEVDKGNDL